MPLWVFDQPLVLASKSVARREMLTAAGILVETIVADIDERAIELQAGARGPSEAAVLLACAKAKAVAARLPGRPVLGADQTLALGTRRFSKPLGRDGARDQLKALRAQTHFLCSAAAIVRDGKVLFSTCEVARLTMRAFSDRFLEAYLDAAGAGVTASVGGYQLEKFGIQLFEKIEGDHFTILGMPLLPLLDFFRKEGWLIP